MHRPAKRRLEFDEARLYEYPQHLREAIADMPCAPGVYIFHAEEGDLPLYIGKSVSRAWALAHQPHAVPQGHHGLLVSYLAGGAGGGCQVCG